MSLIWKPLIVISVLEMVLASSVGSSLAVGNRMGNHGGLSRLLGVDCIARYKTLVGRLRVL